VDPLPGQQVGAAPGGLEPDTLGTEEGAGITVLGVFDSGQGQPPANSYRANPSRIDGFTITGGDSGGGIFVNGWARNLEISNNRVTGNSGLYHGGIRVGRPFLEALEGTGPFAFNQNVSIHENAITENGGLDGAGGGLSLCTGTDGYRVVGNWICGNYTQGDGAGIGHLGLSHQGRIDRNWVLFNQSFNQGQTVSGGGVFIGGEPPVGNGVSLGAGRVDLDANLIQGNQAGAGHGAGIRLQYVNGIDLATLPFGQWYRAVLTNNMIVNNVAGWSGAGVSMLDTVRAELRNNTITNNDSTATVGAVFTVGPNTSANQPAGISAERHSAGMAAIQAGLPANRQSTFSDPALWNNVVWHNRTFHYDGDSGTPQLLPALSPGTPGDCVAGADYWDLGVLGESRTAPVLKLTPRYSVLSSTVGYTGLNNTQTAPAFVGQYCNGARSALIVPGVTTLVVAPALDEGGNFIDVRYGPISLTGNYHISAATAAGNANQATATDYDNETRVAPIDRGADDIPTVKPRQ
jgi:hypothetical protein